ncbi:zinc finger and SCAN domain-containing protein 29-like [Paroedura picta]|uniref:zinc finger and SCAN domain-containing protein 29-like n=1 Tax=Paroedura picta TaxID=143630 RepID=UPI0040562AB9
MLSQERVLYMTHGTLHLAPPFCLATREGSMDSAFQSPSVQLTCRGPTRKDAEIRDLMAIFAEEKIQDALRSSQRNREVFEQVAMRMRALGHHRTGLECRSKMKTMRTEYIRAVSHNQKSGNARVTCPYFEQQREIYGEGDGDGGPKRVGRSLKVVRRPAAPMEGPAVAEDPGEGTSSGRTVRPPPQIQQHGVDLITLDLLAIVPGEETNVLQ